MVWRFSFPILLAASLTLSACSGSDDGHFDVAFMENEQDLFATGVRLSQGGQHVRAAIRSGLVALDAHGEVIPALADRWNVTEEGSIFVFRLRDGTWPNGEDLTAESVRRALRQAMVDLRGTSLGLDLAPIDEVRAMAGRVIEIRLASAMPDLLQLLAQPELGLVSGQGETGLMVLTREDGTNLLTIKPPVERGLPEDENWRDYTREISLHALSPQEAVERFEDGAIEVVLGGRLASLPLADTGPLSRGTVRLDPAIGLFGLQVRRTRGVLETAETREAIAMALDREAIAASFNVGGWVPTTRIVAPQLADDPGLIGERWVDMAIDQRREIAATRIAAWRNGLGEGENADNSMRLALEIGEAPGLNQMFEELRSQLAVIGIGLVRAESSAEADLVLVDRVARYAAPRWFLNQFNCLLDRGVCSEETDILASQALDENNPENRMRLLAEAEAALTAENIYIPFGSPLRWSLIRGNVDGFDGNRWGFHPLPDMAVVPR